MNWMITHNNRVVHRDKIPCLAPALFRDEIARLCLAGKRPVALFALPRQNQLLVYAILAADERSELFITSGLLEKNATYPAITPECPAMHMFERELWESSGLQPQGHPWLKPVRYDFQRVAPTQTMDTYPFFEMCGEEMHQVAVGPVHAGIIEPGHFRFMCHGERVHHLEIQLGYQHRGVEYLLRTTRPGSGPAGLVQLAESIAGDSVIAHASAFSQAIEVLGHLDIPKRAQQIRAIAQEIERIAIHIGDLAAISNDIAYLTGNAVFGANRTPMINTLQAICGNRFGRGLIRVGGTAFDLGEEAIIQMRENFARVRENIELMGESMMASPGVLARLEKAGTLDRDAAQKIGLVGMAARASGIALDVRADFPYGAYKTLSIHKFCLDSGDVFARTYIRYFEILKSFDLIDQMLENLASGPHRVLGKVTLAPDSLVVSMVEGWRGETLHTLLTDASGQIEYYKVKDPSFNNWYGLALAVRENGVSDFPLVNKSFNLSYCGNDL